MLSLVNKHQYHLVNRSQLPFLAAGYAMLLTMSIVFYLHQSKTQFILNWDHFTLHLSISMIFYLMICWFLMIVFEAGKGYHTLMVQKGLRIGFWLFMMSEIMLFFSFFWAYFHYKLNPSVSMGSVWMPIWKTMTVDSTVSKPELMDPYKMPLLNTMILLSSGFTATMAHSAMLKTDYIWNSLCQSRFLISMLTTMTLGFIFLSCQAIEYTWGLPFSWMSNVYWSVFFLLTGFHGMHVVVGTLFLHFNFMSSCFAKIYCIHKIIANNFIMAMLSFIMTNTKMIIENVWKGNVLKNKTSKLIKFNLDLTSYSLSTNQHMGLEAALYYWHFVDVVWIFLYLVIYLQNTLYF